MKKLTYLLFCLFLGIGLVTAQTRQITGTVISADDGEPIIGASIIVKGTTTGTVTDIDGNFSLSVPGSARTLVISYVGMEPQEVAVQSTLRIMLKTSSQALDEVVVTAMGITRAEKSLGYSATTVKDEEIRMARNTNVTNSLQGKVAGLQIQATSTSPGTANSVVIRGFGSINGNNQPLYIVDGVPLQNSAIQSQGHSISSEGISNIPADIIESMTVLKGAAATALYGSRASNGVIVITTKSGAKGDRRNFSVEYNGGMQARQVSYLPDMQNEFGQGWNGAQTYIENGSWGPRLDGSQQVYGPIWKGQQLIHEYSARKDNVREFFDTGISWNHNVSFSGISDDKKMTYYLSYSNSADDGIMPTKADSYNRNVFAFRGSHEATDWLKVSSSVNYSKASTDIVSIYQGTSVIDGLYEMPRDVSIVDMKDLSNPFNTPEAYYTPYGITNPYWSLANNYNHLDAKQLFGKVQVDIKPIQNLTLSYRFGFDYTDYDRKVGNPQISLDDALIEEDYGYAPSNMNQDGYVLSRYRRAHELNHDFLANYTRKFIDVFDLNVNAGVNMNERSLTYMEGQTDILTFETGFWQLSNGASKTTLIETQQKRRLVGLFGDVTLGYDDMLYLNVTARNDWSSTLPIANNSFFYPGATLSWLFTRLLPENNVLTFGKLRLAYGKTGNDADPYYTSVRYDQAYANGYYANDIVLFPMNGANSFIANTTAGSNTLKPEMTTEYEAGLNLQFFKGRLGFDAAFYNRTTSDQIYTLPVDPSSGFNYMVTNFGEVRNQGIELLVSTVPVQTKKFRWDLNVNFAINRNKVLSVPESLEGGKVTIYRYSAGNDAVYMYAEEGKPMGRFYTYLPQFITDKNSPYYGSPIVDSAGQPVISTDLQDTGFDMNPDWTGGVTTSFSAYGLTLSGTLDVRYGGYMFSRTKNLMQFTGNGSVTTYNGRQPFVVPNSVQVTRDADNNIVDIQENTIPLKQSDGSYQVYYNDNGWGNGGNAYMINRSFAKIRNITLAYDLPKKWLKPLDLSHVSVSAFVNNPFMWTAKDNTFNDPETSTVGSDLEGNFGELYVNPSCRVYGFNLSVKF
ncbi:MAG: SusC/RagA family TonB-linked outer membrane protein [Tannerellaceae bacterium]|jgi:TonB-linked SusC/RagA family outer membrane protein|nr:SusC/RagA family TonB-linked outer membrane protein [Tannerellaceae bacterium]